MVQARSRSGFTLIESLVVVFVIGLLAALLLPAVQSAREAARRATCANNLRNVGIGIHNHAGALGKLPSGATPDLATASFLVQILPYVEQSPLYHSINMMIEIDSIENWTASRTPPALFVCPSDASRASPGIAGAVNYAGNAGRSAHDGEGVFLDKPLRPSEIVDGLSNTVGVSEWIVGPGLGQANRKEASKYSLTRVYNADVESDLDRFASDCMALVDVDPSALYPSKGQYWLEGLGLGVTLYNHTLPPNMPSCQAPVLLDATTCGSRHGGVHALLMDGGVRFVKDTIARQVWRAVGTRAGREAVPSID